MNREEFGHSIRTACQIIGRDHIIVLGSQSIVGSFDPDDLPPVATLSREIDLLPDVADHDEIVRLSDMIEAVAGELSIYDATHGFYLDGVDDTTAILPAGWRDRLVVFTGPLTVDVATGRQYEGWCLDPADLCVAKSCAFREKDRTMVAALVHGGFLSKETIMERLAQVPPGHERQVEAARAWLASVHR